MRLVISYILSLLILIFTACGQKDSTKKDEKSRFESHIPAKHPGPVSDFENIFTPDEKNYLDSLVNRHEEITTNQIAIVTLNPDPGLISTQDDFAEFSFILFNKWGVGNKKNNNGVGILFSTQLRLVRIEVGYGLEKTLTNEKAKLIIDEIIIPAFKDGIYFAGIKQALENIFKLIE